MNDFYDEVIKEIQEAKSISDCDFILGKVAELDSQIDEINESYQTQLERIGGLATKKRTHKEVMLLV